MNRRALKIGTALIGLAGLIGIIVLVASQDPEALYRLLVGATGGIALVVAFHVVPMIASAMAWRAAMRPLWHGRPGLFLWARLVRESANALLPVAQVGGDVIGARILVQHGAKTVQAGAGVLVDLTAEFLTQIVFTAIGLLALLMFGGGDVLRWGALGLVIAAVIGGGFVLAQRWGLFRLFEKLAGRVADHFDWPALGSLTGLHDTMVSIYRNRNAVLAAGVWHLASWLLGAVEVWLTLWVLGAEVGFAEALIIESLGQAVRSAAFLVPGALGVQDGSFLALGVMFGLPPEMGLSVSLVKRIRELVMFAPALLAWYLMEGRRLLREAPEGRNEQA